ncbi:alpha/beta hydrolase [Glycomyces paridis]|uniref:Alpha/beta hydrolase n=1 Tax=Glycomyces paridis TaxID=2126555 RepID=A0A4S8PF54_9ACTN|nr:alpha/beta hydrolase [Glycomyces paridis]THV29030.1 alpha/beta hydrolase [Glycomyces paridis]
MSIPYGYLVGLAFLAFPALPVPRLRERPGTLVFLLAMTVNELPFLAIALFTASTGLALAEGDLASPVAIAAAVVGAACIALTTVRSTRTERALQAALGSIAVTKRVSYASILLRPFGFRPGSVERTANVPYGPAGKRNLMDVYRHRSHPTGSPVLIHFHGGYYAMGRKNTQSRPMLHRLASQGWLCISANYRLRPDAVFEDHIVDAKRVVAWVREHAAEWGADPDRIVLTGSSAGAHMSTVAAFTQDRPEYQPGFEDADTSVSAVVGLGGFYGPYFGRGADTDPFALARPDAPPVLVVHGDHDSLVHVSVARAFGKRLREVSDRNVYAELPGAHHGFDLFHSPRFEAVVNAVEAFTAHAWSAGAPVGPEEPFEQPRVAGPGVE